MFERRIVLPRPLSGVRLQDGAAGTLRNADVPSPERSSSTASAAHPPSVMHSSNVGELPADGQMRGDGPDTAVEGLLESIAEAIHELEDRRQRSLDELQQLAVELGVAVASKLVYQSLQADEFAVEKLVEGLLAQLPMQRPIVVRLHPEDLALLHRRLKGKTAPWSDRGEVSLVAEPSLSRGDCRADAEEFGILSRMDFHLSEVRQQLLQNLDHAQIERRKTSSSDSDLRRFPERRETA